MSTTMQAIQMDAFGGPEVMELREVAVPEPGPGEVRLKVAYVGMNPFDAMARAGKINFMPISFPFTPGLEHTGVVDAVGEGVDAGLVGQRVISRANFGAYAEYSIAKADVLLMLDDRIDLKTGSVYRGCSFTAWHALYKAGRLQFGETCLLHSAAGPIGIMGAQIAKSSSCTVIGLAGGPDKVAFAKTFGADHVFDYTQDGWVEQVKDATGGRGVDVIVDGNGKPNAAHNIELLAPLGRVVYIGATAGDMPDPVDIPTLIFKNASVAGMNLAPIEDPPDSPTDRTIIESVATGAWRVPITEEVSLAGVADLHHRLESRQVRGRAVIRVGGDLT
ncbi:MAG: NADPH:quinone reductase [Rhodospirillaceae bacterium]|jgi:NADPH:quinone reductase|nr:NADPH:quinone reductase [Rhodospirillaceae bacterium]MBT5240014.1 NADPH:quinone reductase [Rhodospirillaceae bacterium]MBT5564324.1 NADPH:quinone reductase [Rhodospirillaceae bacterium]MBT6090113.1 NADPH:quinone reductase [Rhodospirillaceae bacterium]MBT6962087.1 NADPH:quinone reductase [Rhodospirillaceae bacterium]